MSRRILVLAAVAAGLLMMARVESRPAQAPTQSPSPKPATGLVFGRVVEAGSNTPVRRAIVKLFSSGREDGPSVPSVMTDNEGQFVFGALPAGSYYMFATKFGYSDGAFGRRRPAEEADPTPIVLTDGERRSDLTVRMWKHAAITGLVVDEFGEPAAGVNVRAFPRAFIAGRPKLGANGVGFARTDDRGVYRLSRLVAGEYVIAIVRSETSIPVSLATEMEQASGSGDRQAQMAMFMDLERAGIGMAPGGLRIGTHVYGVEPPVAGIRDGRLFVYPSQFHGGSSEIASTRAITLRSGQEVTGIDFALKPEPSFRVSGQVTDQNGPVPNLPIQLTRSGGGDFEIDRLRPASRTITDAAGRFTLLGVTPGEHILRALKAPTGEGGFGIVEAFNPGGDGGAVISTSREIFTSTASPPKTPTLFASSTVGVGDRDVDDLALVVRNGVRLTGQVEFTDAQPKLSAEQLTRARVLIEPRDGGMIDWEFDTSAKITAEGKFETAEMPPGFYLLRVFLPDSWMLDSAITGGRDMADVAIEISDKPIAPVTVRVTSKLPGLAGVVRPGASTDQVDEAIVLAFPVDRSWWTDYGLSPRRLREAAVAKNGDYRIPSLPPGDYFVVAVRDDFLNDWHDPAFLDKLSALATRVTIAPGEQKSQALAMGRVK